MNVGIVLFNIVLGIAGFFGSLYVYGLKEAISELRKRDHELTLDISNIKVNYVSNEELRQLFSDHLSPIRDLLQEIKVDLRNKKDKDS